MNLTIEDNVLKLQLSGRISIPNAEEIYTVVFEANTEIDGIGVSRQDFLDTGLKFLSELALPVLVISMVRETSLIKLNLLPMAILSNKEYHISKTSDGWLDYSMDDGIWAPLPMDTNENLGMVFKELGMREWGEINLSQYINLVKNNGYGFKLVDKTNFALDSSNLSIQLRGDAPQGLNGNLYPYQLNGYLWLSYMAENGLGCLMADEMGLGKTIQVICLLIEFIGKNKKPNLIICTATLLENWRRELIKFAPHLSFLIHTGNDRTGFSNDFLSYDIVLTSYDTAVRDISIFERVEWQLSIIDEAQYIKNPEAKRSDYIKRINRKFGIAVTGTPIENKLRDLWSIMDFVEPSILGSLAEFERRHSDDLAGASLLEPIVSPLILRRTVVDVANDLPECIYIPQALIMDEASSVIYDSIRTNPQEKPLVILSRLRMFCTHPRLQNHFRNVDPLQCSNKLVRLLEIINEIKESNGKVLVFTSYTESIDLILEQIQTRIGIWSNYIDGRVSLPRRMPIIDSFSAVVGPAALILNPKAAGSGLNITAANHVVHYNLEWNPAVEDQATARSYRRGQTKPVTVHRLFYADTVEEVINDRMQRKRDLAETAVIGVDGSEPRIDDILKALQISPIRNGV